MRRHVVAAAVSLVVIVVTGAVLASLSLNGAPTPAPTAAASPTPGPRPSPTPDPAVLDQDIGAVLVASQSGTQMSPALRAMLADGYVGGVLLFSSNFSSPAGLKAWSDQLQLIAAQSCLEHPILLMIDEEGGQVNRVQGPFAPPSQLEVGAGGPVHVRAVERISALGLRKLGVTVNLAPVADVRTNPGDAVIGDRSFGSNPATVAPLVKAAVQGLHDGGVAATLKHFPGLGGAAGDPHVAIPTDTESVARWKTVQMPAFQAGIDAGADAVMTTAVYVPGLGARNMPAMFSAPVVGRLRTQLGFKGVIMSDSVSMGGIGARWPLPRATVLALVAGNDLVLLGNSDPAYERSAMVAIRQAVVSGRLDRAQLHASAMRVNALRDEWGRPFRHCRPQVSP